MTSISTSYNATSYAESAATQRRNRPDPAQMAEKLFAKLDSANKGYIEESDLESAISGLKGANKTGSASASEIFTELDSDGNGKVTASEMKDGISKLADALDSQFNQARVQGAMVAPPPPTPPQDDAGFSKDELKTQLDEIGGSDTQRSSLLDKIVQNFDAADTDGDGKVSFTEAMAYDQSTSSSTSSSSATKSSEASSDAQIFKQIVDLLRAYGSDAGEKTASSAISAMA